MLALRGSFTALSAACAVLGSLSCGPSVQSIYEGNVRFEHCYRLDLDLEIVPTHRRHCWEQWLESYRYGQPRDHVEYARRRLRLIASGDFERPLLQIESSNTPAGGSSNLAESTVVRGEPTSVRVPPPPIIPPGVGMEQPASSAVSTTPAPGDECARDCAKRRADCRAGACSNLSGAGGNTGAGPTSGKAVGGDRAGACSGCDEDYKACMRRCFE